MSGVWDPTSKFPIPSYRVDLASRSLFERQPKIRRVEIEDYFIEHETWGSAPRKKYRLTITIEGEGPFPAWTTIPGPWYESISRDMKHTCPLTEAKPGEVMMYACPVCSGIQC